MSVLSNPPSFIEYNGLRFLIHDLPTNSNLKLYLAQYQKYNVSVVCRVCSCNYTTELFEKNGIKIIDLPFEDGSPPPPNVVSQFLSLCETTFVTKHNDAPPTIAIHCIAGLGRAPVLVAIAILENDKKIQPLDVVTLIRKNRKNAFNTTQLKFIEKYQRRKSNNCKVQ